MQFHYPLSNAAGKAVLDDELFFEALAQELRGFFPLDVHLNWHGNLQHTSLSDGKLSLEHAVHCIADGEVIAYRFANQYKQNTVKNKSYVYSDGFCLIKHFHETPRGNNIVFYSVYENLLPLGAYDALALPTYPITRQGYIVGEKALDSEPFAGDVLGIRLRDKAAGDVIGLLPRGSRLDVLASSSAWQKLSEVDPSQIIARPGWVWTPDLDQVNSTEYRVSNRARDRENFAGRTLGLRMRYVARGKVTALLPQGTRVRVGARQGSWGKITQIISGVPILTGAWLFAPELNTARQLQGNTYYKVGDAANDKEPQFLGTNTSGLRYRLSPNGEVFGLLPKGASLLLDQIQGDWAKVLMMTQQEPEYFKGWVWFPELEAGALEAEALETKLYTVGDKAQDSPDFAGGEKGLNFRTAPAEIGFGLFKKGTQLALAENDGKWAKVLRHKGPNPIYDSGWVYVPELEKQSNGNYRVGAAAGDVEAGFAPNKVGIRIRHLPSREVLGLIPREAIIALHSHAGRWARVKQMVSGEALYRPAWVWVGELDAPQAPQEEGRKFKVRSSANDSPDFAAGVRGLNMRTEPAGDIMGLMPKTATFFIGQIRDSWAEVSSVLEGEALYQNGWVWVPELDALGGNKYRVGTKATDREEGFAAGQIGIRMREIVAREVIGLLPRGSIIELHSHTNRWAKIRSLQEGIPSYRRLWVWLPDIQEIRTTQSPVYHVGKKANDLAPSFAGSAVGLRLRTKPHGGIMGLIPKGSTVKITQRDNNWAQVEQVTGHEVFYASGWVYKKELDQTTATTNPHELIITRKAIKAGDIVGYAAKHESLIDQQEKQINLSVFSADHIPTFLSNPMNDVGGVEQAFVDRETVIHTVQNGNQFLPSSERLIEMVIFDQDQVPKIDDAQGKTWYLITGVTGGSGNIVGWVSGDAVQTQTSLRWPGFKTFSVGSERTAENWRDHDDLARLLKHLNLPLGTQPSAEQIRGLWQQPAVATALSQLIMRKQVPWAAPVDLEAEIDVQVDEVLEHSPIIADAEAIGQIQGMQRDRLADKQWWEILQANNQQFPQLDQAYFFHPLAFIRHLSLVPDGQINTPEGLITLSMLQTAHKGSSIYYRELLPYMNEYAGKYRVSSKIRIAHFLSQIGHESGFQVRNESLKYTVSRMRTIFGNGGRRTKLWTKPGYYAYFYNGGRVVGNDVHLGDYVYSNRLGNGSESSGDGFRYRGKGMIQLTGKTNYRQYTTIHNRLSPNDRQDFVANPELVVENNRYGVESAFVWWEQNGMNALTDRVNPDRASRAVVNAHIKTVTKRVNGGTNGLTDRINKFWKVWTLLKNQS
ncbi:MAG: Unknown protein [uncultured Thiotrichaceae bacterium]|uniref:Chitinase n=1 Tax=uncultured Thiotrichaceae bacterium TaxID=298394 RepID=A0A6S6TCZ0_9GAMM|nr:MAG: Unknown protein [uncultured Thiotrichaceae bacterium]